MCPEAYKIGFEFIGIVLKVAHTKIVPIVVQVSPLGRVPVRLLLQVLSKLIGNVHKYEEFSNAKES